MILVDNKEVEPDIFNVIVIGKDAKHVLIRGVVNPELKINVDAASVESISISDSLLLELKIQYSHKINMLDIHNSGMYLIIHHSEVQAIRIDSCPSFPSFIFNASSVSSRNISITDCIFNIKMTDSSVDRVNIAGGAVGALPGCASIIRNTSMGSVYITDCKVSAPIMDDSSYKVIDLSGSCGPGLFDPQWWAEGSLKDFDKDHYLAYKAFGLYHKPPDRWELKPNSLIEEVVDYDRHRSCSHGVNCSTPAWLARNLSPAWLARNLSEDLDQHQHRDLWKVAVPKEKIVVPYATDGKFRSPQAILIGTIDRDDLRRLAKADANQATRKRD